MVFVEEEMPRRVIWRKVDLIIGGGIGVTRDIVMVCEYGKLDVLFCVVTRGRDVMKEIRGD